MASRRFSASVLVAAALLAGCEETGGLASGGFRNDYLVARQALETANYAVAIRGYGRLVALGGPLEPRLRLELAHSLLRGGVFAEAEAEATHLLASATEAIRGSALAVRGTARHEQARAALEAGAAGPAALTLLEGAVADLSAFVQGFPALDAAGMMAARLALARSDLRSLGG
ncbi:MAG: hypothetical protein IT545_01270 [Rhodobacteraceae bacterium]|nr:hypothetical protein [Paracoccaceae bacterium]